MNRPANLVHALSLADLEREIDAYDRTVLTTPGIDHFCSSSDWMLPAHEGLMPPREPWIRKTDAGYIVLAQGQTPDGRTYLQPFEAAWGLGCPLVGAEPTALVPVLVDESMEDVTWDVMFITGIIFRSRLFNLLVGAFEATGCCDLYLGPSTRRYVASLEGGLEGFLGRRSRNFRKGMRRAERRANEAGIQIREERPPDPDDADLLYTRIQSIEHRSWKGRAAVGINIGDMREFYGMMLPRLIRRGSLRLMFARDGERDVGFILGATLGPAYRGLQFSFDDAYRTLGLGNAMQMHQIRNLVAEGLSEYDLGSEAAYKPRWAEGGLETVALIVRRY